MAAIWFETAFKKAFKREKNLVEDIISESVRILTAHPVYDMRHFRGVCSAQHYAQLIKSVCKVFDIFYVCISQRCKSFQLASFFLHQS
jgi:hypothetical protein